MASMNPPVLLALVLCDTMIREAGTNKLSLIGTFNGLYAKGFPCVHPALGVYVAITDGRGRVPCKLRMSQIETNQELFSLPGQVEFQDPTGVAEMVFHLQQLRFEKPGDYAIEFIADGEFLGSRRLRVQEIRQEKPPGNEARE